MGYKKDAGEGKTECFPGEKNRCIVVGAGDFHGLPFPVRETDLVIAADGGYQYLKACGIRPDLIMGDFDSMKLKGVSGVTGEVRDLDIFADAEKAGYLERLGEAELDGIPVRIIDPVKNDPDMAACLRIGLRQGIREFHLLGGTGGRMDHSIANLQLLGWLSQQGCEAYLYGEKQVITALTDGSRHFGAEMRGFLSVLCLSDCCTGVTEKGLKYIIRDVALHNTMPTGLSNEFVGTESDISVKHGTLLLIYDRAVL